MTEGHCFPPGDLSIQPSSEVPGVPAIASPAAGFSGGDEYSTHTSVTSFIIKPSQIIRIPGGTLRHGTTPVLPLFQEQCGVPLLTPHGSCDHPATAVETRCLVFLPGGPSLLGA